MSFLTRDCVSFSNSISLSFSKNLSVQIQRACAGAMLSDVIFILYNNYKNALSNYLDRVILKSPPDTQLVEAHFLEFQQIRVGFEVYFLKAHKSDSISTLLHHFFIIFIQIKV